MKKTTLLIVIGLLAQISFSQSKKWQDKGWAKFKKTTKIDFKDSKKASEHRLSGNGLKEGDFPISISEGEIYKNIEYPWKKDFILFGIDTLRCPVGFDLIGIEDEKYKKILDIKDEFIKKQKGKGIYKIDISKLVSILGKDKDFSVKFTDKKEEVIKFEDKTTTAQQIKLPNITKLIIPGFPTLIYEKDKLKTFQPIKVPVLKTKDKSKSTTFVFTGDINKPNKIYKISNYEAEIDLNKIEDKDKTEFKDDELVLESETFFFSNRYIKTDKGWIKKDGFNYMLILWFVLLVGVLFVVFKLLKNKIGTPIYTEEYQGGSFREFTENNDTTVKKLIKYNKNLFGYNESVDYEDGENQKILKNIRNKKLKKGNSFFKKNNSNSHVEDQEELDNTKVSPKDETADAVIDLSEIKTYVSGEFKSQADFIIREISNLKSNSNDEVLNLKRDLDSKENEILNLNKTLNELDKKNNILKEERDKLNDKSSSLKGLYAEAKSDISKYTDLINFTPFLNTLGYNYFNLLECLSDCQKRVNNLVVSSHAKLTIKEIEAIFKINTFYPNSYDTGYWRNLFQNLSKGFLSDAQLVIMLNDFQNENEKTAFLEKYFYKNFWEKYINTVLLYVENIRLLSEFTGEKTEISTSIEKEAAACVQKIVSKSRELANYDINYVSLLDNYEKYTFTKVSSKPPVKFFLNLQTESENIIQIISFGFKNNHQFENEKTWIIIK